MRLRDLLHAADRMQKGRTFKIAASGVVVLAAIAFIIAYAISLRNAAAPDLDGLIPSPPAEAAAGAPTDTTLDATREVLKDILAARKDAGSFSLGVVLAASLCLAVIWLGLGLTMVGLALGLALLSALAWLWPAARAYLPFAVGVVVLTGTLAVLMRLAGLALSGPGPVLSIARAVLIEASRLKLTTVPIILLLIGLASLPGVLSADQPLRYRVQSFLQFGTGSAFWLIAALVLTFSVATVAFDQRDRTIWQTITKPVKPWQYVLGKWLGASTLGAVLLAVSGAGVFFFVDHLRSLPARGEREAYVAEQGPISEDRLVLESQVLTARVAVANTPFAYDRQQFMENVLSKAEEEFTRRRAMGESPEQQEAFRAQLVAEMEKSLEKSVQVTYRSIAPGAEQYYKFEGLLDAKKSRRPIILRYKVNSGSNSPDALYRVTIEFAKVPARVHEVVLAQWQYLRLTPEVISDDGVVEFRVINGDVFQGLPNPETITFPPDALEMSYAAGSFPSNFARVMLVLWIKIAFLAMLGVCLATFLSFPVAIMVAGCIFMAAEGASYLNSALESYWTTDRDGNTLYLNVVINAVATVVAKAFQVYSDLRPTDRLVEGLRMHWSGVGLGAGVLGLWTTILFAAGSYILGRRELAVYSGH